MTKERGVRAHPVKTDLEGAIAGGVEDIQCLLEEMREWQESLESADMTHMPKYDEVSECVSALERIEDIDGVTIPEAVARLEVNYVIDTRRSATSRNARMANAASPIRAAVEALTAYIEELAEENADNDDWEEPVDVEALRDEVEGVLDEVEYADFPGMY